MIVLGLIDDVKMIELKGLNFRTVEMELEKKLCWYSAGRLKVLQAAKIRHFLISIFFN